MSTLEELLRLGLPSEAEVLAGATHLWREVTWVVRLRARPPAIPPLAGGELVLVSSEALQALDARPRLARIVDRLAELGAIGAAVVGPVASDAEQVAERNHFPLIQLPPSLRTDVLELELQRWLVQRKLDVQHELAGLHQELMQLVLAGGFPALLDRTVSVTRKPTLLQGVDWEVRMRRHPDHSAISTEQVDAALAGSQREAERWITTPQSAGDEIHLARIVLPKLHLVRLVAQVSDGQRPGAYLSLVARPTEFGEWDAATLLAAASAGSIELVREHASTTVRDGAEGDLLQRLRNGQIGDGEALAECARELGVDLNQPHTAVVLRTDRIDPAAAESLMHDLHDLAPGRQMLAERTGQLVVALVPSAGIGNPDILLEWHQRSVENLGSVSGGVSGPAAGVSQLAQALAEAKQAQFIGERLFGPDRLVSFAELGVVPFLLRSCPPEELQSFHAATLGNLIRYDAAHGTELVVTLEAFFAGRCSPEVTARRLHLHRNGLLYRLQRIEKIAGVRLNDPETLLALHLALRAGQVVSLTRETSANGPRVVSMAQPDDANDGRALRSWLHGVGS